MAIKTGWHGLPMSYRQYAQYIFEWEGRKEGLIFKTIYKGYLSLLPKDLLFVVADLVSEGRGYL